MLEGMIPRRLVLSTKALENTKGYHKKARTIAYSLGYTSGSRLRKWDGTSGRKPNTWVVWAVYTRGYLLPGPEGRAGRWPGLTRTVPSKKDAQNLSWAQNGVSILYNDNDPIMKE